MRKRLISIALLVIFILQMVQFGSVFAENEKISLDMEKLAQKRNVMRGSLEYGEFDSQKVLIFKPGFTDRQASTTAVLDYVLPDKPIINDYRYAVIEYYKTDNDTTMKFRPSLNGKMKYITFDGTCNRWHRAVWEMIPEGSETTALYQFHFFPFGDQDANSVSDAVCYIKSIEFYKENPLTEEEIAFNEQIVADISKNYESLRGVDEELAIFEDLDKLDKTSELVADSSFENESEVWTGYNSTVEFVTSDDAYDGKKYAKITGRNGEYSGMTQNLKDVLNKYGPGDYRLTAYIKTDKDAPNTYKDYKLAISLNGREFGCSTYHIKDEWQKINGALRLTWNGQLTGGFIKISSVDKTDLSDFYVDKISLVKCLYNEVEEKHTPYMKGNSDGTFAPQGNITRAETCAIISRLMNDEAAFKGVYLSNYPDIKQTDWYYDNIAYLEALGLLTYFKGNFNPNAPISRAEFVYIAKNISKLTGSGNVSFSDVNLSHPLYNDVVNAAKTGLVAGYEDGTFHPDACITRAEACTIVNRAIGRNIVTATYYGAKVTPFSDVNDSHWAYSQIVEATTNHDATIIDKGDKLLEAWKITAENYDAELAKKVESEAIVKGNALKDTILNAKDNLEIAGTKYYISNNGDDNNSGLSPNDAWKSIDKVNNFKFSNGDAVLFERGGLWRGATVLCQSGVTYAAYGEGEKPKLYGSDRNYADTDFWLETDTPNVWKTKEKFSNVGFIQFDGEIMSQKIYSKEELNKNYNFMQEKYSSAPLLLYYDGGNPGEKFKNIEIAPEYSIFIASNKSDIRIDNICIKYTGWHGVKFANVENVRITNCEVGWIGGTGGSPTGGQTRWGNGIEFWQNCKNVLVDHCYVYQVYDTAFTNQWKGETGGVVVEEDVTYTNNLVDYCTYAFEFFMNQPNSNSAIMKNVKINDNICRYTGYGWGQDNRPNKDTSADIKGWSSLNRAENFVVENNIFLGTKLTNVHYASYSNNIPGGTKSFKNMLPQHLIKLNNNIYINNSGKAFVDYNFNKYSSKQGVNYDFIKDNVDLNAKLILTDSKFEPDKKEEATTSSNEQATKPSGENLILNSDCDNTELWKKNTGAKGKLTVEEEGGNKYLTLADRVGAYERIEIGSIADKLNQYGPGTYQVLGRIKMEGAMAPCTAEIYILASSYKGTYEKYNTYTKVQGLSDEWSEFSITVDTSKLEFTTWPSDTTLAIGEASSSFATSTKLCIDDIMLIPINTKNPAPSSSATPTPTTTPSTSTPASKPSNATGENLVSNSDCDNTELWKKNTGAKGKLTVEEEGGNKYLSLANRVGAYERIEIGAIADKLNQYGPGTYEVSGRIKMDGALADTVAEVYILAPSYKGTYEKYNTYTKVQGLSCEWSEFNITVDTSKLEFTTWPSDTTLAIGEASSSFDPSTKLCIDDIKLIPVNTKNSASLSSAPAPSTSTSNPSSNKGEASNVSKDEIAKNILLNGTMDKDGNWTLADKTPKAVSLTIEKESDGNSYIKMAGRTADWIGMEQTGFASKLKAGKTYVLKMRVKIENDVNSQGELQFYMLAKSNAEFKVYKKFTNIGDSWKNIEYEFTLDSAPSDVRVNFRAATTKFDNGNTANYNICFDDVVIVEK
ncbi:MAG: hypothetical protein E7404_06125 [Ruminococcaceae bacterium]|nr:hypothetical protein [Oscillospiraceae bacterium]